jgi:tRNA(fMet)-specific endonuclease VapC
VKYILDTDSLSLIHSGHERTRKRRDEEESINVATTIVTRVEILRARFDHLLKVADEEDLLRAQRWLASSEELLRNIEILAFHETSAAQFKKLRSVKKLKRIGNADLLIASIALARKTILITRNVKHFRLVPNLKLENWAD